MLKNCDGLVPIITLSSQCIREILETNKGYKTDDDEGIIGYLVANVNYLTSVGNPQIDVVELVAGQTRDDDGEVYPLDTKENQVSIRYESIILDVDEDIEDKSMQETFDEVLQTHQVIFDYSTSVYKITCQHFIYPDHSVFKFYFPFNGFSTTFTELSEEVPKMQFIPGQKPFMNVQIRNLQNGRLVEAQIHNVIEPNDPTIQPMITELAAKYSNAMIKVAINNKAYQLEVRQSSDVKMYYTACISRGEGCSVSFGRIGVKTDGNYQYQKLAKKIEDEVKQMKEELKAELAEQFQKQLTAAVSDIRATFEEMLKSQFDRLAAMPRPYESKTPVRASPEAMIMNQNQTPVINQTTPLQETSSDKARMSTHGKFKKVRAGSKTSSTTKRIQSQGYDMMQQQIDPMQYQKPVSVIPTQQIPVPVTSLDNEIDDQPIPKPITPQIDTVYGQQHTGMISPMESRFESKRQPAKQDMKSDIIQQYNTSSTNSTKPDFAQEDVLSTPSFNDIHYSPQSSLSRTGGNTKQNDLFTSTSDGFQFSPQGSSTFSIDSQNKPPEEKSKRKTKAKKPKKDSIDTDPTMEFSVSSRKLFDQLGIH